MKKTVSSRASVLALAKMVRPGQPVKIRRSKVAGRFGGYYLAEVTVDGNVLVRARHADGDKVYKGLAIELSKMGVF